MYKACDDFHGMCGFGGRDNCTNNNTATAAAGIGCLVSVVYTHLELLWHILSNLLAPTSTVDITTHYWVSCAAIIAMVTAPSL